MLKYISMNANLIVTDSYFNIFPLLTECLNGKTRDLTRKNFVFCEEKLSLMAERAIVNAFGGTFNTEVYSFGNFLRAKKTVSGLLSKEGSSMVVKKILSEKKIPSSQRPDHPVICDKYGVLFVPPSSVRDGAAGDGQIYLTYCEY